MTVWNLLKKNTEVGPNMRLEDIGIEPCYRTEAQQIQFFKIPDACELYIFVKSELHSQKVKRKLEEYYGANNGHTTV